MNTYVKVIFLVDSELPDNRQKELFDFHYVRKELSQSFKINSSFVLNSKRILSDIVYKLDNVLLFYIFKFFPHHHVSHLCPLPPFSHPTWQANAEGGLPLTVSHDHPQDRTLTKGSGSDGLPGRGT